MPTCDEVAALTVGDLNNMEFRRDIVVKLNDGSLTRIPETHTAFIPLQYPLLFPYGENGYQEDIPLNKSYTDKEGIKRFRVSLREFVAFRIQDRSTEYGTIVLSRRHFQQFLVDTYTMIESQRLLYIRNHQNIIRSDFFNGLEKAISRGETDPAYLGRRIIVSSSFTGGSRYMFNNFQDAMTICKKFGYPYLFITITCNSSWNEIDRFVRQRGLRPDERPDICCRVFKMKLNQLISDIKKGSAFGPVDAG